MFEGVLHLDVTEVAIVILPCPVVVHPLSADRQCQSLCGTKLKREPSSVVLHGARLSVIVLRLAKHPAKAHYNGHPPNRRKGPRDIQVAGMTAVVHHSPVY